jgi:hypothetical protein
MFLVTIIHGLQVGTAAYSIAIAHLINHTRDARGAIAAVTAWLHSQLAPDVAQAADTVLDWLSEAQAAGPGPRVYKNMGFMRWGFVHAFRCGLGSVLVGQQGGVRLRQLLVKSRNVCG